MIYPSHTRRHCFVAMTAVALVLLICPVISSLKVSGQNSVILLSAPSINEPYYSSVFPQIIAYDIAFANQVNSLNGDDRVIILTDAATRPYLSPSLPDSVLITANIADIWIRDFSPVMTSRSVKFDFRPSYLSNSDATYIDNSFRSWYQNAGLNYDHNAPLVLDGGNFVWNRGGKAILTERVFADNPSFSHAEVDSLLKNMLLVNDICYLPEEAGDLTGHSDGMAMFIDTGSIFINTWDEPFRTQVISTITASFPGVQITEVPYPYDTTLWNGWPSACGIYLNSLVTENCIYMPVYGLAEDSLMLDTMQAHTAKQVIAVEASAVCYMGGSVRCLTMVASGNTANTIMALAGQHPSGVTQTEEISLLTVTPNPFTETALVQYYNPDRETMRLDIFDICGKREVSLLSQESLLVIRRDGLARGIHILKLIKSGEAIAIKKIIIR